jgi:CBS domain-containing protein
MRLGRTFASVDAPVLYVSKLVRLPLLDADVAPIGRLDDVVLSPTRRMDEPPKVLGFVATVQRRRIFVNAARVGDVGPSGVRLHSGTIDVRHFELRPGELLAAGGVLDRRVGNEVVSDLGVEPSPTRTRAWQVATVALRPTGGGLRRRAARIVGWREVASLFDTSAVGHEVAELREMHPADVAERVRRLPLEQRRRLAAMLQDEQLADVLEELPEAEVVQVLEGLDLERVAHVLEEMEPDDAADLLAEMPGEQRRRLLDAMEPEEADDLRRLLRYGEHTAGGLMTPEPVVLTPDVTVSAAHARLRDPAVAPQLAAQVFVAEPPSTTPTGAYLGVVGFQRLLREPPGMTVGRCIDDDAVFVDAHLSEAATAERLAAYDLMAVAVCDGDHRLLGAVTVDDVLDAVLPTGWRSKRR